MEQNKRHIIDESVREALKNLEASYNPQHWQMMEQRLRHLDDAEAAFDKHIQDNVDRLQKSYQSKHWEMMSQRLDEEFSWKSKIVRYKVVEVALMLLLIATGINYYENDFRLPSKKSNTPHVKDLKSAHESDDWRMRLNESDNNKSIDTKSKPTASLKQATGNNNSFNKNNTVLSYNTLNTSILNIDNSLNVKNTSPVMGENSKDAFSTEGVQNDAFYKNKDVTILNALPILYNKNVLAINASLPDLYFNKSDKKSFATVEPISRYRGKDLTINQLALPIIEPVQKKSKWWLSMFGVVSADRISSTFYLYDRENKRDTFSYNIGNGLSIGKRLGKWEIQTGLSYVSKKFPLELRAFGGSLSKGYYEEKLKSLTFDITSIPLNFNYHFFETKKWRLFTQLGTGFNTILYSQQDREAIGALASNSLRSSSSNYAFNEYSKGLLEKGLFSSDVLTNIHYFTANLGVGAELNIGSYMTLFTRSSIEAHIGRPGIGTLNDRINSISVQTGIKVNLGKGDF